jgi:uncharacterized protein YbbK (DUF523 family)
MTNAGINMMRDPKKMMKNDGTMSATNRTSYSSVNRAFGKDITHKVLNSSGAAVVQSQNIKRVTARRPSPSCNSNY